MAGAVFGNVVHAIAPHSGGSVGAYALVGMGAVFAGAARAAITAVVILFELTGEYTIILPLGSRRPGNYRYPSSTPPAGIWETWPPAI